MTEDFIAAQKNLEFWTEYSDMLSEKMEEIQNAKEKLLDLKAKSNEKITLNKWELLNADFLSVDGCEIPGYIEMNPLRTINLQSEKIDAKLKFFNNKAIIPKYDNNFNISNYDSYASSDDSSDENICERNMSKSEFFEAADDILREVEEEFKSIPSLLQKMVELQKK